MVCSFLHGVCCAAPSHCQWNSRVHWDEVLDLRMVMGTVNHLFRNDLVPFVPFLICAIVSLVKTLVDNKYLVEREKI